MSLSLAKSRHVRNIVEEEDDGGGRKKPFNEARDNLARGNPDNSMFTNLMVLRPLRILGSFPVTRASKRAFRVRARQCAFWLLQSLFSEPYAESSGYCAACCNMESAKSVSDEMTAVRDECRVSYAVGSVEDDDTADLSWVTVLSLGPEQSIGSLWERAAHGVEHLTADVRLTKCLAPRYRRQAWQNSGNMRR